MTEPQQVHTALIALLTWMIGLGMGTAIRWFRVRDLWLRWGPCVNRMNGLTTRFHRDVSWTDHFPGVEPSETATCHACDFRLVRGRWQPPEGIGERLLREQIQQRRSLSTQNAPETEETYARYQAGSPIVQPGMPPVCPRCRTTPLTEVETVCVECLGTQFMNAAADRAERTGVSSEHAYTAFHKVAEMLSTMSTMKATEGALVKGPSAWERVLKDDDD